MCKRVRNTVVDEMGGGVIYCLRAVLHNTQGILLLLSKNTNNDFSPFFGSKKR